MSIIPGHETKYPGSFIRNHFNRRITNAKNKSKLKSDYLPIPTPSLDHHPTNALKHRSQIISSILNNDPRNLHQALRNSRSAGISIRTACNRSGIPLLCVATRNCTGICSILKLLISFGANVNDVEKEDGYTSLHHAVTLRYSNCVEYLLRNGADPNAQDAQGRTPLMIASFKKYEDIQKLLQIHGADPELGNPNSKAWGTFGCVEETHDPYFADDGSQEKKLGIRYARDGPRMHMRYK